MSREQYILGVNGINRRTHSASACLLMNGELVAMAEEERFSRKKNAFGEIPHNAISYCLQEAAINLDDIDAVGIGWDLNKLFSNSGQKPPSIDDLVRLYFPRDKFKFSRRPRIEMFSHHLAHAASTYYFSGYSDAGVLVMDGQGEVQSTSLYEGKGDKLTYINEFPIRDSLGYFYEAISDYIGLSALEPGKTMGLASYGRKIAPMTAFELTPQGYRSTQQDIMFGGELDQQVEVTKAWVDLLSSKFGLAKKPSYIYDPLRCKFKQGPKLEELQKDIAAVGQYALEVVALHLTKILKEKTGSNNLCIAGGVGLNCSMNGRISRADIFNRVFLPPFVNDAGVSAGAALLLSVEKPKQELDNAYYGPQFTNDQIKLVLDSLNISYQEREDISRVAAELIAANEIVAWFQGRMEVGPRALGNRSLFGNPTIRETHFKLNTVKNREMWRPLAPSLTVESIGDYVEAAEESPFMIKAFQVREDAKHKIPAAVHVDGTARPQTVSRKVNPLYFDLIDNLKQINGVPVVMNTSFNLDYEPIVCTPYDAIRSFFASSAKALALGNFLVKK